MKSLLSLGLVAFLIYGLDWAQVALALRQADLVPLVSALAVLAFTVPLAAERWHAAARAVHLSEARGIFFRAMYAAAFVGQFLPAAAGVDAARVGLLVHRHVSLRLAMQSVFVDRVAGLSALVLLMFAGLPFVFNLLPRQTTVAVTWLVLLLFTGLAVGLMLDRMPFLRRFRSRRLGQLFGLVRDTRRSLKSRAACFALGYAIVLHIVSITTMLLIARAFGLYLHFDELLTIVSFAIFASLLPISMNGWGVREGAMVLGLSLLAVDRETAVLISFLFGIGSAIIVLPGSFCWYRNDSLGRHARDDA